MLSAIGLLVAIVLFIFMVVKGVDMVTSAVVTAVIIILTSGLSLPNGLFDYFSEGVAGFSVGAAGFVQSWMIILALGGIFGELVGETGLAVKIAKTLSKLLGPKNVGLTIMICVFLITLLGINGYIMVFVLYPIADNMLRENGMDRRLLPFLMICGGANANSFMFSMDVCNVIPTTFLGTSTGAAPGLSIVFSAITCVWYVIYFNKAQKKSMANNTKEALLAMYKDEHVIASDDELPNLFLSLLPFVLVLVCVVGMTKLTEFSSTVVLAASLFVGVATIIITMFGRVKANLKALLKKGSNSGLSTMLTVAAVVGLSKVLAAAPAFAQVQQAVLNLSLPVYFKTWIGTLICGALTGSAITAETLFLESFGKAFIAQGANANALHRICAEAGITLNKLPNASPVVMETTVCQCTIAESYMHIVWGSTIPCLIGGFVITLMATMGIII